MHRPTDKELDCTVAKMLQTGLSVSALVVLVGGAMLLKHPLTQIPDYSQFHAVEPSLRSLRGISVSALHCDARGLVQFGMMLLIATPVVRVMFCAVGFIRQRNTLYTVISSLVLVILIYGLTKGMH